MFGYGPGNLLGIGPEAFEVRTFGFRGRKKALRCDAVNGSHFSGNWVVGEGGKRRSC